jgi:hypothetical protein
MKKHHMTAAKLFIYALNYYSKRKITYYIDYDLLVLISHEQKEYRVNIYDLPIDIRTEIIEDEKTEKILNDDLL